MAAKVKMSEAYLDLPSGKVASVQTFLEMRELPPRRPDPAGVVASIRRVVQPDTEWYLALFHKVGEVYLWFLRLAMSREVLQAIINDPREEIYVVEHGGSEAGMLELDFRTPHECEIAYFALTETHIGAGTGRWLMNRTIEFTWSRPINRLWVHTCSLDHPNALDFYRRSVFVPYARKIEIADDPRLRGLVPRDAAPQVPIL